MAKSTKKPFVKGEKNTEINKKTDRSSGNKTSKEIVKRHFSDENDKITEDDFKNLKIDLSLPEDKAYEPLQIPPGKERPKDADKDNIATTPWDVISE